MNSKQTAIRALGQRSITSSFLSRSSNPFKKIKEDVNGELATEKDSCVSLSDFLDRKLHKNSLLPKAVQGKSCPFSSPIGSRISSDSTINGQVGVKREGEEEKNNVLDKVVFEQFKHTGNEKGDTVCPCSSEEVEIPNKDNAKESRKRKEPFEGAEEKHTTRKPFVVLGGNASCMRKSRGAGSISMRNKKPRPPYNHYANGCGWWDSGMEGVDSEEVGYGEVWEGVGSTTFGGIEWH
ncbi:Non-specific serine/threonine protein kinase [Melia azedarach]|uniref:Non-specific serine/threonine protein kinase n=1 Tax=Melia azedarach TaxID=155640 RepID=A0ACC1YK01_MELAZ|nr:Non-specific serine/threonine protein kinase [Melia azedarach]